MSQIPHGWGLDQTIWTNLFRGSLKGLQMPDQRDKVKILFVWFEGGSNHCSEISGLGAVHLRRKTKLNKLPDNWHFISSGTQFCLTTTTGKGARSTPGKVGMGCAAHFLKPLPYLRLKSEIFATLFMTWPKIQYPIYDRFGWQSCPKHKFWRAFVDGVIDKEEKVASSKKHTQFKTRVQKPCPIYDRNGWKITPFRAAHTYIAYIRACPPPLDYHWVGYVLISFKHCYWIIITDKPIRIERPDSDVRI